MKSLLEQLNSIKARLFGNGERQEDLSSANHEKAKKELVNNQPTTTKTNRAPYDIRIGYDFGTSYSKCIYRDEIKDRAWIYFSSEKSDLPFLIPSVVIYENDYLKIHDDIKVQYPTNGLFHLKFAIASVANKEINNPVLDDYKKMSNSQELHMITDFVECCGVFYLATTFSTIVIDIKNKFCDFGAHDQDRIGINMAIPVAHASQKTVEKFYQRILKKAFTLIDNFELLGKVSFKEFSKAVANCNVDHVDDDTCFVYPEVSANVQALVRSPAFSPSETTIYFFCDTGAGTVDQSVFTHTRPNANDDYKLNYFSAEVLPCGSSHIDRKACGSNATPTQLEHWRQAKEANQTSVELRKAREQIENELRINTYSKTLNETQKHLYNGPGVDPVSTIREKTRIIYSGGGHCENPYENGVNSAFMDVTREGVAPDKMAMPIPGDLEINSKQHDWMKRLYVAYGLSFSPANLQNTTYPDENALSEKTVATGEHKQCSCRGVNPSCLKCGGRGYEW